MPLLRRLNKLWDVYKNIDQLTLLVNKESSNDISKFSSSI